MRTATGDHLKLPQLLNRDDWFRYILVNVQYIGYNATAFWIIQEKLNVSDLDQLTFQQTDEMFSTIIVLQPLEDRRRIPIPDCVPLILTNETVMYCRRYEPRTIDFAPVDHHGQ